MLSALAFLTVVGRAANPEPKAVPWFGPVGALVGAAVGGAWWGASHLWSALIAAVLAVTVDLFLTGMLHFDGLADSGDGLLPPVDRPRRLEILRTPEVGAFGLVVVVIILALRVAAFAAVGSRVGGVDELATHAGLVGLVAAIWAVSRCLVAGALGVQPYARSTGLAERFVDRRSSLIALVAAPVAVAGGMVVAGWVGAVSVVAAAIGGVAVLALSQRRLGGFTGDTLGAAIVVGETVGLLIAAAQW